MTGDVRRPGRPEPIDDLAIEQLVREVAAGWTMPAVRLDAPSWRDRVRSPGARRVDSARGLLGRLGRAASAAVALTVMGALVAVLVTRPGIGPGKSAGPTDGRATPAPTGAASTPLPKLLVEGGRPSPSTVLTEIEEGDFALVDLATGERGRSITGAASGSILRQRPDGTLLCLCVKLGSNVNGQPTEAEISLDRFDADGAPISSVSVLRLAGEPDPRDGVVQERPPHLTFDLQLSADGRYGVIGWSVRKHPAWDNGVTIIDLQDGQEAGRLVLPEATDGDGDTRRVVMAPRLLDLSGDGSVAIAREWYSWSPPESAGQNFRQETEVFRATVAAGALADAAPLAGADGCGQRVLRAGRTADGASWLLCMRTFTNGIVVRRLDAVGTVLGDTTVSAALGVDGSTTAVSPDGRSLFSWNPAAASLDRIDLATGDTSTGQPPQGAAGAGGSGALDALAAWLAPSAAAKSFLYGGIVISPDGTRVYAVGIEQRADARDVSGSSGIFVFDAATLASLGHWGPAADYISLGVSADGRYVYASGLPRVDAAGTSRPGQQASITVHAAADGAVQVIAGQLGEKFLVFADPVLR